MNATKLCFQDKNMDLIIQESIFLVICIYKFPQVISSSQIQSEDLRFSKLTLQFFNLNVENQYFERNLKKNLFITRYGFFLIFLVFFFSFYFFYLYVLYSSSNANKLHSSIP